MTNENLPANTTRQEDMVTAGQRRINIIWEATQSVIAIMVVLSNLIVGVSIGLYPSTDRVFPDILGNALFLVIGFYFSRTNHTAIGGTGDKPSPRYEGR